MEVTNCLNWGPGPTVAPSMCEQVDTGCREVTGAASPVSA